MANKFDVGARFYIILPFSFSVNWSLMFFSIDLEKKGLLDILWS